MRWRRVGLRVSNLDATVVAQAPRMGPHSGDVCNWPREMGVAQDRVNVKATTTERMGYTGRGRDRCTCGRAAGGDLMTQSPPRMIRTLDLPFAHGGLC